MEKKQSKNARYKLNFIAFLNRYRNNINSMVLTIAKNKAFKNIPLLLCFFSSLHIFKLYLEIKTTDSSKKNKKIEFIVIASYCPTI